MNVHATLRDAGTVSGILRLAREGEFSLTARENVALVTESSEAPLSPEEALRLVGLGARLDHFPSQLSGAEPLGVVIARAIAKRPDLLMCDEPTGALDAETGRFVLAVIYRLLQCVGGFGAMTRDNGGFRVLAACQRRGDPSRAPRARPRVESRWFMTSAYRCS